MGYNGEQEIEELNYEKRSKRTVHVKKNREEDLYANNNKRIFI